MKNRVFMVLVAVIAIIGFMASCGETDDTIKQVATPTAAPAPGAVAGGTSVVLSTTTAGATIYYTTNGSNPTTSSSVYSSPIVINTATTIKAFAVKTGMDNSEVLTAEYTIDSSLPQIVATPTATPAPGAVASGTSVSLSTTTAGAIIYYTTNGSNPTTSSSAYSSPIVINTATTIKAIAVKEGMTNSLMLTASYTIQGGNNNGGTPPNGIPANWKTMSANDWDNWVSNFFVDINDPTDNEWEKFMLCVDFIVANFDELPNEVQPMVSAIIGEMAGIIIVPFIVSQDGNQLKVNMFFDGYPDIYTPEDDECPKWNLQNDANKGTFPIGKWVSEDKTTTYMIFTSSTEIKIYFMEQMGEIELTGSWSITGNRLKIVLDW